MKKILHPKAGLVLNSALLYLSAFAALIAAQVGWHQLDLHYRMQRANYYCAATLKVIAVQDAGKKTKMLHYSQGTVKMTKSKIIVMLKNKQTFNFVR